PAAVRVQHRAAPRSEHDAFHRGELGDRLLLAGAKPGLALDLENERDLHPAALLDLVVRIEEAQLEAPGEEAADGGLAGPHQADQEDVPRLHPGIVGKNCRTAAGPTAGRLSGP